MNQELEKIRKECNAKIDALQDAGYLERDVYEKILKELKTQIDALIKHKYDVRKYYWTDLKSLYFIEKINGNTCYGYGVDYNNNWITGFVCYVENIRCLASESEVIGVLTKEVVKLGLVEGANFKPPFGSVSKAKGKLSLWQEETTYGLCYDESEGLILDNGIWATVIKPEFDKEVLIKEANKRYPFGSKYTCVNGNTKQEVKGILRCFNSGGGEYITDSWGGIVYENGIWASVIKERSLKEWYKGFMDSPLNVTEYTKSTKAELIEILNNLDNEQ